MWMIAQFRYYLPCCGDDWILMAKDAEELNTGDLGRQYNGNNRERKLKISRWGLEK